MTDKEQLFDDMQDEINLTIDVLKVLLSASLSLAEQSEDVKAQTAFYGLATIMQDRCRTLEILASRF